jgi:outer membrane protein
MLSRFRTPLLVAFCAAVLSPSAFGQLKVAVVSLQKAIIDTADIKKAQADLEARYRPRQAELEKLTKEIRDLQEKLQTMSGKLTPQAEQEMVAQGQRKQREAQRIQDDLTADVDRDRQEILGRASQRMTEVVKKVAEEKGLDLVVEAQEAIFFKPALDITKDATTAYDKAYPAK